MGVKASRLCEIPLAKFTRIQKLSGGSTAKVNHIKGKEFEQLVPAGEGDGGERCGGSDGQPLTEAYGTALESEGATSGGGGDAGDAGDGEDLVDNVPGATATSLSEGSMSEEEPRQPKQARPASLQKMKSNGLFGDEEERKKQHRTVKGDGETKKVLRQSEPGHRTSLGVRLSTSSSKVNMSSSEKKNGKDEIHTACGAIGRPFPKRPIGCKLSNKSWAKLEVLFSLMDEDGSNAVTREEARGFFHGAFSNLSVDAMFNEVDTDGSGAITSEEFVKFWIQVRGSGYKEQDILDELDELIEGGAWVDWKDGRDTVAHEMKFPKRPMLCRLSGNAWHTCQELFHKISNNDDKMQITRDKAQHFFKGAFCNISADAMFNEIDVNHHGVITPKEFMKFWVQLRSHGYKEKDILEEIDNLMEGSPWVDWKDGRNT
mmetsp:Transcript_34500/g.97818  ORF Transcript_34500/g.97818 Transcript_34500/m.97818 type:complete len:430 (+) Transcript_34500:155-1444(+)|eukprot:CAMPEP_0177188748 /NCGR_PEP_ID=MMETSP0367-20130122/19898_1 /TAXON_ID=447022 ORGANISM="Scrippsiella hangoei-like, Strain SHHI-4" /NCGR_SAMPLE_ID=MMETSP0367 /ASSEMBLY_ACC=CAM_ASM_000362 /LENGTH=429 /DNA_ID=CAMNT_0018636235 /DNA_START=78 /DNA_END=1367 /DNA_ORIENTATION=-